MDQWRLKLSVAKAMASNHPLDHWVDVGFFTSYSKRKEQCFKTYVRFSVTLVPLTYAFFIFSFWMDILFVQ